MSKIAILIYLLSFISVSAKSKYLIPLTTFDKDAGNWTLATMGLELTDKIFYGKKGRSLLVNSLKSDFNHYQQKKTDGFHALYYNVQFPSSGWVTDESWFLVDSPAEKSETTYTPAGEREENGNGFSGKTYGFAGIDLYAVEYSDKSVKSRCSHIGPFVGITYANELIYWTLPQYAYQINPLKPRVYIKSNQWCHLIVEINVEQESFNLYLDQGEGLKKVAENLAVFKGQAGSEDFRGLRSQVFNRCVGTFAGSTNNRIYFDNLSSYIGKYEGKSN